MATSGVAIFISLCLIALPAVAETDTAAVSLSSEEIDARMDNLTASLRYQEKSAERWEYGWGAFDSGTMIWGAVEASQEHNRRTRGTDIVQAGESLIGLADVVLRPLPAFDSDSACSDIADTGHVRMQCLAAKEALLERSAERAGEPYEWIPHLGNAGFNLLAGLIVKRIDGTGPALSTAIPGELIGELQLWTTPGGPLADFDRYRMQFSPLLIPTEHARNPAAGVMISLRF